MIRSTTLSLHIIRPFGRRILKEIFKPAAAQWIWLAFRGSLMGATGQAVRVGVQTWPHGSAQVRLTSHNNDLLDAASFSECPFLHLLAVALLVIICLSATTNFTSPFYHQNLRVVRGTPTPRGWHQNSEVGCGIMSCVLNCWHCNIFFLLEPGYALTFSPSIFLYPDSLLTYTWNGPIFVRLVAE